MIRACAVCGGLEAHRDDCRAVALGHLVLDPNSEHYELLRLFIADALEAERRRGIAEAKAGTDNPLKE